MATLIRALDSGIRKEYSVFRLVGLDDVAIMVGSSERTEPRHTLHPADFPTNAGQASPGMALRTWL
ncbi:hypothetical protein [Parafrankia sp. FMc2]|uniref:hypothetical protein n=1 Tax=Parafrankia sp. FMc2 TaxID=3233196 RepID=UPI0034D52CC1